MGGSRKKYSQQFKVDAVKMILEQGHKASEVARNLEIHISLLQKWKREYKSNQEKAFEKPTASTPEQEELKRLRKEVAELRMEKEILKKGRSLLRERKPVIFNFVRQQKEAYPVNKLCEVMGVSKSGFYRLLKERPDKKVMVEFEAISKVREIHKRMNGKYGSRRMSGQLTADGFQAGREKAKSLMKRAGVAYRFKKKFRVTTDSNHSFPIAPNLLNREFYISAPNRVWCTDLTYRAPRPLKHHGLV